MTSLWHNSFDDLLKTKPDELVAGFGTASVEATAAGGEAAIDSGSVLASFGASDAQPTTRRSKTRICIKPIEVLSSIPQGRTLRDDAKALGWKPNHKFKGKLILAAKAAKPVTLGDLKVTVAGPMQAQLLALQEQHDEWLRAQKEKKKKSPEAALAAFVDKSDSQPVQHRRPRRTRRQKHAADGRRPRRQDFWKAWNWPGCWKRMAKSMSTF